MSYVGNFSLHLIDYIIFYTVLRVCMVNTIECARLSVILQRTRIYSEYEVPGA